MLFQAMSDKAILEVRNLHKRYKMRNRGLFGGKVETLEAVKDVSFSLRPGETIGLVGESGCGKSSLARSVLYLDKPSAGTTVFDGRDMSSLSARELRTMRQHIQVIFQDPYGSLDPRFTIRRILQEPWNIFPDIVPLSKREARLGELLTLVGLHASDADRYPHQFSGGQRQRIGIARALALEPKVIICDEPVSALDVSVQAQVVNLLEDLQSELGLAYLFIAHDLSVVHHISDSVMVMYLGEVVESGPVESVFKNPKHPYSVALLSAVPIPDPKLRHREMIVLEGEVPNPLSPPSGCTFHPRCVYATELCKQSAPPVTTIEGATVRCHFAGKLDFSEHLNHLSP
jgi:oligopeptide transport system ATP-binding protein